MKAGDGALKASRMFQPCLRAVSAVPRRTAKMRAPSIVRKQPGHVLGPLLFFDFDQSFQFAQVMGVAQRVEDALQAEIGCEMVVDQDADHVGDDLAGLRVTL